MMGQHVMERCMGGGKVRFERKRDAQTSANHHMRRHKKTPGYLRVYHCPKCNGWHLTHEERRT